MLFREKSENCNIADDNTLYNCGQDISDVMRNLKEPRNCILCIICVRSLFCAERVYISLHFPPILLVKLNFRLSLVFSFYFFSSCFEFNVISKDLIRFFNFLFTLFKRSVKDRLFPE